MSSLWIMADCPFPLQILLCYFTVLWDVCKLFVNEGVRAPPSGLFLIHLVSRSSHNICINICYLLIKPNLSTNSHLNCPFPQALKWVILHAPWSMLLRLGTCNTVLVTFLSMWQNTWHEIKRNYLSSLFVRAHSMMLVSCAWWSK